MCLSLSLPGVSLLWGVLPVGGQTGSKSPPRRPPRAVCAELREQLPGFSAKLMRAWLVLFPLSCVSSREPRTCRTTQDRNPPPRVPQLPAEATAWLGHARNVCLQILLTSHHGLCFCLSFPQNGIFWRASPVAPSIHCQRDVALDCDLVLPLVSLLQEGA